MTEEDARRAIVAEALTWIGTPYISGQMVKGKRGGTDCAMILVGVYGNVGLIPKQFRPEPYSPQWHVHRSEEKYLSYVLKFAHEIEGPPLPGDLVTFKIGNVMAHGAVVTEWPMVVHAVANDRVMPEDVSKNTTGKRALMNVEQRFFSFWPKVEA
jgi:cell wall-associated NlpC family hydrolase